MHGSLVSFVAALSFASSALALDSHYSHQAIRDLSRRQPHHGIDMLKSRALGQRGRGGPNRMSRRGNGEAVLKCTSTKTFELCDGDRCTDMGSVAAGTMCVDGAITWDTSAEVNPDDSQSASSSIAEFVSTKVEVAASSLSVSSVAEPTILIKQNAVQKSSSLTTPGPAPTFSSSPSSGSASSGDDDASDDDDWECEADAAEYSSTTTTSAAAQTTTVAPQLAVKPATTTQAPTTTSAAAPLVSASVSVGTGSGDWITGGKATFFYQEGGYGACGKIHQDSDKIVALQIDRYGTSSNNNPDCGRTVEIENLANGKTTLATVADACPGCANYNSLDLSVGAFDAIGDQATGVLNISWRWVN
ncbi:RlpA-like double-psi beta-barrel domain-containing protein [Sporobolomyces koalae]|uniref:RlpA-like double-psi beta-barrel domain-containing protein n=1 Tax=Sporobolomyces koalae TaxID=500713 RepID=UPI0031748A0F